MMGARALALVLLVAAACTRAGPLDPEPLLVVSAFNETGGMKWLDLPALNGFSLAIEEIQTDGGLLGRPLEVTGVDGTTDPLIMGRRLEELLEARQDVLAVVGLTEGVMALPPRRGALRRADGGFSNYDHSAQLRLVAPSVAGVPLITVGSTDPDLSRETGPLVFSLATPTDRKVAAMVEFARRELGVESVWSLVDTSYDYSRFTAARFQAAWRVSGGSVLGEAHYGFGVTDLLPRLEGLLPRDPPPDAVFLGSLPSDGGLLLAQIRQAGFPGPVLAADWFDTPYIEAYAGELADGLYYSADVCLCDPGEEMQRFIDEYRERYGEPPRHGMAVLGYEGARLIADAVARAGSADAAALGGALAETRGLVLPGGRLAFEGDLRSALRPVAIVEVREGEHHLVQHWEG